MKYFKPFLASLAAMFVIANSAYAGLLNKHNMLPNNIPASIQFNPAQPGGNTAEIFFQNSTLPAKFLCYFASNNSQKSKEVTASITSENTKVEFMPNVSNTIEKTEPKMFTVTSVMRNGTGSILITLNGDMSALAITMLCTMHK